MKEELESLIPGLTCWFDINGIETGTELVENIIDAIDHSKFIIYAIYENSLVSEWTKKEILYANNKGIPIFPGMLVANEHGRSQDRYALGKAYITEGNIDGETIFLCLPYSARQPSARESELSAGRL